MVVVHNGIICGGLDYVPKLEKVGNTDKLTFYVLMTRGGNLKKNYDVFQIKAFGGTAKRYYEELKDNKSQGKTVSLQMSLENNSNGFIYEFICTFVNFALGEELMVKDLPDYARVPVKSVATPKETSGGAKEEKLNKEVVIDEVPMPAREDEVIETAAEVMGCDAEVILHAPIGLISSTRSLFKNAKLVSMKKGVTGELANNEEYLVFRDLMGY